jgi:hypothetical protein
MPRIRPIQVWHDVYHIEPLLNDPAKAKASTLEVEVVPQGRRAGEYKIVRAKHIPIFAPAELPQMDCSHDIKQCPYVPRAVAPSCYRFMQLPAPSHGTTGPAILIIVPERSRATMPRADLQDPPESCIRRDSGCRRVGKFYELLQKSTPMTHTGRHLAASVIEAAIVEQIVFDAHVRWGGSSATLKKLVKPPPVTCKPTDGPCRIHSLHPFHDIVILTSY